MKAGQSKSSEPSDQLTAKDRFSPPKIDRTNIKDVTIKAGQNIRYDIKVSGAPAPTNSWFHNKARIEDDNYNIETESHRTKLTVPYANRLHTGTYTLKAENESGHDEASFEVIVLDKPSPPEGPLRLTDVHKEGCKLKWNPPLDDGGLPIEHYVVEKMDVATGRWLPSGRFKEPFAELNNLEPGNKYIISVYWLSIQKGSQNH